MQNNQAAAMPPAVDRRRLFLGFSGLAAAVAWSKPASAKPEHDAAAAIPVTHYRTATVDGIKIFYREAGPKGAPVVLLLHGFPTSSHMFRNLIPALADRYHVIAPDYPGYGQSDVPTGTNSPTRSIATASWSTACSVNSASPATLCT